MILVDTNILLRLIQIGHPHQKPALESIALLHTRDGEQFASCPQVLYEMYVVCTRPADATNPGLGLSPIDAMSQIEAAQQQFPTEPEQDQLLSRWKELVVRYGVTGKSAHDARLAAVIIERRIPALLTFNDAHFARYSEFKALNPFDVLGVQRV